MRHFTADVYLSAPPTLSPGWAHIHRTLVAPFLLILTLKDKLTQDFKYHAEAPWVWINELTEYYRFVERSRLEISSMLPKLRLIAPKTFDVGHGIRNATLDAQSALNGVNLFNRFGGTANERDKLIMELRTRVFNACNNLSVTALAEELEAALRAESSTSIDLEWIDEDNVIGPHYGIVIPATTASISWDNVATALDHHLPTGERITPGTGIAIPDPPEPLPPLAAGVPFYDVTDAWITGKWGGPSSMPPDGRTAWSDLLNASRRERDKIPAALRAWSHWLRSQWESELVLAQSSSGILQPGFV